ncbi:hypothetical protein [Deinococcus aquatilis]|uniref:hypothetical protein n=1 Tax=Deinococcus aquatilis TaxID=519440 RepID=UPI0012FC96EA|nr:hypothetical protein [Deinococcus aquatilis]
MGPAQGQRVFLQASTTVYGINQGIMVLEWGHETARAGLTVLGGNDRDMAALLVGAGVTPADPAPQTSPEVRRPWK